MPKKLDKPTEKVTLRLTLGSGSVLKRFYPEVGYNAVIRTLVDRHCAALLEAASRQGVNQDNGTITAAAANVDTSELGSLRGADPAHP